MNQIKLPRLIKASMTINNGEIIIADMRILLFIDKHFNIEPLFLNDIDPTYNIDLNWHIEAITIHQQNKIIVIKNNNNRAILNINDNIDIYPISNYDSHTNIAISDYGVLLSGQNGIDLYDFNFNFLETLIKEHVYFIVDTLNNIATIGNKKIKGYSSTGELLIERPFNVRNIHDFQLYIWNHALILYDNEPFGVIPKQKIVII